MCAQNGIRRVSAPLVRTMKPVTSEFVAGRRVRGHLQGAGNLNRAAALTVPAGTLPLVDGDLPLSGSSASVRQVQRPALRRALTKQPEREPGRRGEDQRLVRARKVDEPTALAARRHLGRPVRAGEDGRPGQHERGLDLRDRPARMALLEERGRPGDVRGGHARSAPLGPRPLASRNRREHAHAGRAHVRLHLQRDRRRPAGGEARDHARPSSPPPT